MNCELGFIIDLGTIYDYILGTSFIIYIMKDKINFLYYLNLYMF